MTYLLYILVLGVAYLLWYIIKFIINTIFPNFYERNIEKFQPKEVLIEDEKKEIGSYRNVIAVIIFFIMLAMIQNYYKETIRLKNQITRINKYKTNKKNYSKENKKLKNIIKNLEKTNYFKNYYEIKTKYEKLEKENKIMKIYIKGTKKETNYL